METKDIAPYNPLGTNVARAPNTVREVAGVLFRRRRLIVVTFLATLGGVILAVAVFGMKYEAQTQILVKHQRTADVVSPETNPSGQRPEDDNAREREINTEVELLQSEDLLSKVVKECGLDSTQKHLWSSWIPNWNTPGSDNAKAVRSLKRHLRVYPLPDSNIIQVEYTSRHPKLAAQVLQTLDKLYIAKHVAVYHPAGALSFFQSQAALYQKQLLDAEAQLTGFNTKENAPAPEEEKDLLLKQADNFDGQFKQSRAEIDGTEQEIRSLRAELAKTPARLPTAETKADNPQLMADLKSTLQNLEIQRTDLLSKFQPTYRPVVELNKQIAQVKASIAAAQKAPMQQNTTDQNPTYQMLQSELAKDYAKVAGLRAQASGLAPIAHSYSRQALVFDQKQIKQQDLLRNVTTAEQNYLLYLNKSQQAQISDALDRSRILNVSVSEAAIVPSLPVTSSLVLILAGCILAFIISMGSAFAADYFDQSFRTPDDVVKYLDVPVLAAVPLNGSASDHALRVRARAGFLRSQRDDETRRMLPSESGEHD